MKKNGSSFMDRRLKERLVGATILVVLIVLIVPELLSGPKRPPPAPRLSSTAPAEAVRNVTMDLATNRAVPDAQTQGAGSGTPPAAAAFEDAGRDAEGAPASSTASGAASSETATARGRRVTPPPTITTLQAQQQAAAPLEKAASSAKPPTSARSPTAQRTATQAGHHDWTVQLGSFATRANAQKLERKLRGKGYPALVSWSGSRKTLRFRVWIGPMADRAGAEKMVARLRKDGHSARIVAPGA